MRRAIGRPVGLGAVDETAQLDERAVAFLDAEVDHPLPGVTLARYDENPRTAAAAPVAAGGLGRVEGCKQALGERAGRLLERRAHLVPGAVGGEHVPLRGPVAAARVARLGDALRAGVLGDGPAAVDDPDLPELRQVIGGAQAVECVGRRGALGEQLEPGPAVAAVGERLRRDRADSRPSPGHGRAGVERLRLHGDAKLAGRRIPRHDRVRHRARLRR